ncbi:MFS transporter [Bacillus licheniformis]|nr:MFS transporter [Bacillus licheniformis]
MKELLEPWVRPALIAGVGLAFLQQFIGTNTIIYYAPKRLRMSDLKIRRPFRDSRHRNGQCPDDACGDPLH